MVTKEASPTAVRVTPDQAAVGLERCDVSRTVDGAVEIVDAAPEHRSFPPRVGEGVGICLKNGPAHRVCADGRDVSYPDDAICIRGPGCVWSTEGTGPVGFLSLDVYAPLLPEGLAPFAMTFVRADTLALPSWVEALRSSTSPSDEVIARLLLALGTAGLIKADALRRTAPPRAAARARERLESDVTTAPLLSTLARDAGTDQFSLLRSFKQSFGTTPHAYLMTLRVERARRLIANGAELIAVAHDIGFADQAHLTRVFKRVVGMTPGQYRHRVRAISFKSINP